jgi:hypothetical protein
MKRLDVRPLGEKRGARTCSRTIRLASAIGYAGQPAKHGGRDLGVIDIDRSVSKPMPPEAATPFILWFGRLMRLSREERRHSCF